MKAPREARPHTPAAPDPQRQPRGTAQRRVDDSARQHEAGARNGGLPAQLRSGLEALSGLDMSDVRVHRNSSKPAQLEAAAYAQGRDIHLAPGQDHHLPHEAWHVVQQRQGRVRATTNVAGVPVNDQPALEREADVMGRQAVQRMGTAQLGKNGGKKGDKNGGKPKPQISDKERRKRKAQSKSDRQANVGAKYSVDATKHRERNLGVEKTKEINRSVKGHGSGKSGEGQNAATSKSLAEAKERTKQQIAEQKRKEKEARDRDVKDWKKHFHDDRNDNGGSGGGIGVLVS